jgi:cation diffusion facilitator CzcD-associated flavoprotein CzcO
MATDRKLTICNLATGAVLEEDANVVISARGFLTDPAWPTIPGLESFGGQVIHSARWEEKFVPSLTQEPVQFAK